MQPGVQDNNSARAAVASNHLRQCTALWIVTPIIRAVDDKTAQTLLDKSIKRQLQFEGLYSDVTFICSKTDEMSITEVEASLGLTARNAKIREHIAALDTKIASSRFDIDRLREEKDTIQQQSDALDKERDRLDERRELVSAQSAPSMLGDSRKRHRSASVE